MTQESMKLYPEDPRLSAYVLGELNSEDAAAVESAAAADPSLQRVIEEMGAMQGLLAKRLQLPTANLLPEQRENIRRSVTEGEFGEKRTPIASIGEFLKPWLIPAAAVIMLTGTTLVLLKMPDEETVPVAKTLAPPEPVAVVEPEPPKSAPPWSPHRAPVKTADFPTLELPILAETGNLEMIRHSVLTDEKLPAIREVKLEEVLNAFPLRISGVTAIARRPAGSWHPDSRDSGITAHVATLSTEMIVCPWKPSATLLLISLRGNAQRDCAAKLVFRPNPGSVLRYRLLGSTSETPAPLVEAASRLPAKAVTTLAIEIEPANADRDFGSLEWFTDDLKAPSIALMRNDEAEPSDDARFAALVCTYAQWLAGEQVGFIDADIVAALAREVASGKLEPDRVEFLSIIDKSLHL